MITKPCAPDIRGQRLRAIMGRGTVAVFEDLYRNRWDLIKPS